MSVVFNISFTPAKPRKNASALDVAEWHRERTFYNLTAKYNYVSYTTNGIKTDKNKDILKYMEKSTGAFNHDGNLSKEQIKQIREQLALTDSIIWHGFVSFDKDTSKSIDTPDKAREYMKRTFSTLFENSHLNPANIEMMESLHVDKEHHHHIHFAFWEKEPTRIKGGKKVFTEKGCFSQKCIDNYLIAGGLYLENNEDELHQARNLAMSRLKELMPTKENKRADITKQLTMLAQELPKTGRLGYNSSNMKDVRGKVDSVVNSIVARDGNLNALVMNVYGEIAKREKLAEKLARENKILWTQGGRLSPEEMKGKLADEKFKKYGIEGNKFACIEKLKTDFKARLGNEVIKHALKMKKSFAANQKRSEGAGKNARRVQAKMNSRDINKYVYIFMRETEQFTKTVQVDFRQNLRRADEEIEREIKMRNISKRA